MGNDSSTKIDSSKMPKYFVENPVVSAKTCSILVRSLRNIVGNVGAERGYHGRLPFLEFYDVFFERIEFLDPSASRLSDYLDNCMQEKSLFLAKLLKLLVQIPQNTKSLSKYKLDPASLSQLKLFASQYSSMKLANWALVGDALFYAVSLCDELYSHWVHVTWVCAYSIFLRHLLPTIAQTRKKLRRRQTVFTFEDDDEQYDLSQVFIPPSPRTPRPIHETSRVHLRTQSDLQKPSRTVSYLRVQTENQGLTSISTSPRHMNMQSRSMGMSSSHAISNRIRSTSSTTPHYRSVSLSHSHRSWKEYDLQRAKPIMFEEEQPQYYNHDKIDETEKKDTLDGTSSRELQKHLREIYTLTDSSDYALPATLSSNDSWSSNVESPSFSRKTPSVSIDLSRHETTTSFGTLPRIITSSTSERVTFNDYDGNGEDYTTSTTYMDDGRIFMTHTSSLTPINRSRCSSRETKKYHTLPLELSEEIKEEEIDTKNKFDTSHIVVHTKNEKAPKIPREMDVSSLHAVYRVTKPASQEQMLRRYSV